MSIGRFQLSGASATAESTFALANINFDFSLLRFDAPAEFKALGECLNDSRLTNAEEGNLHVTARRLGAAFQPLLPPTPRLIKAYGLRASDIAKAWKAKEADSESLKHLGIFSKHEGIDAGSIWAGATSGSAAIQVHLAACLLARMWTGPEATAIWVDLLESRRREVQKQFEQGTSVEADTAFAVMQRLSRSDLAEWDASARSWLRIADAAKERQQKQLLLIVGNLDGFVNVKSGVYSSVLDSWTAGLKGMEALLEGCPVKAQSGDMLPALSSWHLYPDMSVLDSAGTFVSQQDPLMPISGILTFGAPGQQGDDGRKGLQWSLPLAHLRFYGDPVHRTSSITTQGARLTLPDFNMAVLGCVLGGWRLNQSQFEPAILWIRQLAKALRPLEPQELKAFKRSWIHILGYAAEEFLSSRDLDKRLFMQLLTLGKKHAAFLSTPEYPFFGLAETGNVIKMTRGTERKIRLLRDQAKLARLPWNDAIIRYFSEETGEVEYASAAPRSKPCWANSNSGETWPNGSHVRWIRGLPLSYFQGVDPATVAGYDVRLDLPIISLQSNKYEDSGEEIGNTEEEHLYSITTAENNTYVSWGLLQPDRGRIDERHSYNLWLGDADDAAIFVRGDQGASLKTQTLSLQELKHMYDEDDTIDPVALSTHFGSVLQCLGYNHCKSLLAFSAINAIYAKMSQSTIDVRVFKRVLASSNWFTSTFGFGWSLPNMYAQLWLEPERDLDTPLPTPRLFQRTAEYIHLDQSYTPTRQCEDQADSAVRSSKAVTTPLAQALQCPPMTRAEVFNCIILLESNLDISAGKLEDVIAISSNDSLFIADYLLLDPSKWPEEPSVWHAVGNVGKPGVALLVPPVETRIARPGIESWCVVNHEDWDGHARDCFRSSSLHLSFTGAAQEVDIGFSGAQDKEIYRLESVVSLFDGGKWIADLDIRKLCSHSGRQLLRLGLSLGTDCPSSPLLARGSNDIACTHQPSDQKHNCQASPITAIENWSELLEEAERPCIVLAHENWQARLAATVIAIFQKKFVALLPDQGICWKCVINTHEDGESSLVYIY